MKQLALLFSFFFVVGCGALNSNADDSAPITNFSECIAAGNAMMKSLPARCRTADGREFIDSTVDGGRMVEGVCVDRCGDGTCQEIVCMGQGCPCPESAERCPQDCR